MSPVLNTACQGLLPNEPSACFSVALGARLSDFTIQPTARGSPSPAAHRCDSVHAVRSPLHTLPGFASSQQDLTPLSSHCTLCSREVVSPFPGSLCRSPAWNAGLSPRHHPNPVCASRGLFTQPNHCSASPARVLHLAFDTRALSNLEPAQGEHVIHDCGMNEFTLQGLAPLPCL